MEGQWKTKMKAKFWHPKKVGAKIQGVFVRNNEFTNQYGKERFNAVIMTDKGEKMLPPHQNLNMQLKGIKPGIRLEVTLADVKTNYMCEGQKKYYKIFRSDVPEQRMLF